MVIYLDVTKTLRENFLTGVQRVVIEYLREMRAGGGEVAAVSFERRGIRRVDEKEIQKLLERGRGGKLPSERRNVWSWNFWEKKNYVSPVGLQKSSVLFAPGGPTVEMREHLKKFERNTIIVHDMTPLTLPEWATKKTLEALAGRLESLESFDVIVIPSESTKKELEAYWKKKEIAPKAKIVVIEHGVNQPPQGFASKPTMPKKLLCLGSLEARKNHLNLLGACEKLWNEGEKFELRIVGLLAESGKPTLKKIKQLEKKKYPLAWRKALSDKELEAEWRSAWAMVYPSHEEGFGLPVAEALSRGVPVVCGAGGALKERVREGGCEFLREVSVDCLYFGIRNILREDRRENLAAEARAIKIRGWKEAAREVISLFKENSKNV